MEDIIDRIETQSPRGGSKPMVTFPNPQQLSLSVRASALVFEDPESQRLLSLIERVAPSDATAFIRGETGTGKEVVSRAIHTRSKRADGPFIRVNCGAIPPELVDSQLFGHEKGSFTGAADQHQGWFERADRGTLFLDEIGELPLPAQVRLLRVLQDHQIERVGGKAPLHVDVRIVAATHRDLYSMVKEKTFREDLWYRINIFPILLPTLRERLEDIPSLVRHFAQRAATRFGLPVVEPGEADLQLLARYDWPGNIRELGAVIDRAAILGGGRTLDVATALG
ncbi:sigma-54-dependent Fis family transcriptional regulator, partial [bacterium]|nr:sigma-54-dependent Fis family transcriptional regulator [bacterium]